MMTAQGIEHQVYVATNELEAFRFARDAGARDACVVAVGGDGTLHHVVRGIIDGGGGATLGVLPTGTGNDFARTLGMPPQLDRALACLLHATPRTCDVGRASWVEQGGTRHTVFVNVFGCGFDAVAAGEVRRWTVFPRFSRYAIAAVGALPRWRFPHVQIFGGESETCIFDERMLFMSVGNGPTTGGGIRLTPEAHIDDGLLDACIVRRMSVLRAITLLPAAMRGRHTRSPEVQMVRSTRLVVRAGVDLPLHADGEILTSAAREVTIHVQPQALKVLAAHEK